MDLYPDERRIRSAPEYTSSWFGVKGLLATGAVVVLGLFFYFMDDLNVFLSGDEKSQKNIALQVPAPEESHLTPVEKLTEFSEPVIHKIDQKEPAAPEKAAPPQKAESLPKEVTAEIRGDEIMPAPQKPMETPKETIAESKIKPQTKSTPLEEKTIEKPIVKITPAHKSKSIEVTAIKETHKKPEIAEKTEATYALQLLGSSDKAKIHQFINERKLNDKAVIAHTKRGSEDWYIVLYGNYSNREEALMNIKKLPSTVHDVQPWPRKFADSGAIIK